MSKAAGNINLVIGDGSTWSMRAWMSLNLAGIDFEEIVIPLSGDDYKAALSKHSDTMLVPVLRANNIKIHDSLAIAEFANELSDGALYPKDLNARSVCRSLCAELHSGFPLIRNNCPYYLDGKKTYTSTVELEKEINRIKEIWSKAEGQFYFGAPSLADVFYSVMAHRLFNYDVQLSVDARQYQNNLLEWDLFKSVLEQAKAWQGMSF
ncbi:MAG: glutathione S-transferase N-terminal domain-containing protein [Cellvibrionaceae bacterium]